MFLCDSYRKLKNVFNTLTLKTKTIFQKLEYSFLVESTKIENTSFPYKTATSEANVKTNRMVATKRACQKEWSLFLLFVSAGVLFDGTFSL